MYAASLAVRTDEIGVEDLVDAGFTSVEIAKLSALKENYPFIEYVESDNQWRRLLFMKWRYRHGDLVRK